MKLEDYKKRYNALLKREKELWEFIDKSNAPYEERIKRLPEHDRIVAKLNEMLYLYFPNATSKEILEGFKSVRSD